MDTNGIWRRETEGEKKHLSIRILGTLIRQRLLQWFKNEAEEVLDWKVVMEIGGKNVCEIKDSKERCNTYQKPLDPPLEEGTATHPVFLPRESHGQRSLAGYSPWG